MADGMMKKIMRILMTMVFTVIIIFPHSMISSASELSEGADALEHPIELGNLSFEDIDEVNVPETGFNVVSKPYLGSSLSFDGISPYADDNTNPNAAYILTNNTNGSGTFTTDKEERWYAFILKERSKVSIRLNMDAAMDADLYVFSLNSAEGTLSVIGGSTNSELGKAEYYSAVLEEGT